MEPNWLMLLLSSDFKFSTKWLTHSDSFTTHWARVTWNYGKRGFLRVYLRLRLKNQLQWGLMSLTNWSCWCFSQFVAICLFKQPSTDLTSDLSFPMKCLISISFSSHCSLTQQKGPWRFLKKLIMFFYTLHKKWLWHQKIEKDKDGGGLKMRNLAFHDHITILSPDSGSP